MAGIDRIGAFSQHDRIVGLAIVGGILAAPIAGGIVAGILGLAALVLPSLVLAVLVLGTVFGIGSYDQWKALAVAPTSTKQVLAIAGSPHTPGDFSVHVHSQSTQAQSYFADGGQTVHTPKHLILDVSFTVSHPTQIAYAKLVIGDDGEELDPFGDMASQFPWRLDYSEVRKIRYEIPPAAEDHRAHLAVFADGELHATADLAL